MTNLTERASLHAALGDPVRLAVVDALSLGDLGVEDLRRITGVEGNLLAHHLRVLEDAGLVVRRPSEGDRRRRYVTLRPERLCGLVASPLLEAGRVLFVCLHNSARSQYAAALWGERTGRRALSAGAQPAEAVHPQAVEAAAELGIDLSRAVPKGYHQIVPHPDLVVSVCDRARESGARFNAPRLHWSVPDPVAKGDPSAFLRSFGEITARMERLIQATRPLPNPPADN